MQTSLGLAGKLKYTSWVKAFKIQSFQSQGKISPLDLGFIFQRPTDGVEEPFIIILL